MQESQANDDPRPARGLSGEAMSLELLLRGQVLGSLGVGSVPTGGTATAHDQPRRRAVCNGSDLLEQDDGQLEIEQLKGRTAVA